MLNYILSKKDNKNKEKNLSFECGFERLTRRRLPFSLQFYLISVIFLIFDVEISLILPLVKLINFNYIDLILNSLLVILILLLGLVIEWKEGALNWFK